MDTKGGGNLYWIDHGEEKVLYAHLMNGSPTASGKCKKGKKVDAGDPIGLVGASATKKTHLHMHAVADADGVEILKTDGTTKIVGRIRPVLFRDVLVARQADFDPLGDPADQPWVAVNQLTLPYKWIKDPITGQESADDQILWPAASPPP